MKIAYITADFGIPVHGNKGASIHVRELSQALKTLGHEVRIFTPRLGGDAPADFDVPAIEIAPEKSDKNTVAALQDDPAAGNAMAKEIRGLLYATSMRHRLLEYFRSWRPDAIYERYSLFATAGTEIAHELDIPHFLEVNAPLSKEASEHRGLALQHTAECLERRILNATSHIGAVSEPIRSWAISLGVDRDRVTVLPNGVNIDRFAHAEAVENERLNADDRPVVGFVGTLKAWHGTSTLIKAISYIARVNGKEKTPRLLIVGDGPQREMLEQLAVDEGIADLTVFTGSVQHGEIPSWIARMDIAVAPYDDMQNFYFSPLKVFEYMAAGKAIVASRIGQITSSLTDAEDALLYQPGSVESLANQILNLLNNPEMRDTLAKNARASAVANHSWSNNASSVISHIQQYQKQTPSTPNLLTIGGKS